MIYFSTVFKYSKLDMILLEGGRMKREWLVKTLALGIVALFTCVGISPGINADINNINDKGKDVLSSNTKEIAIYGYKADGTIEKNIIDLSKYQIQELKKQLNNAINLDEKLSICKDFGLIPDDVTSEKLCQGMEEIAKKSGFTRQDIEKFKLNQPDQFYNNFFCSLDLYSYSGFCRNIGSSIFLRLWNGLLYFFIYQILYGIFPEKLVDFLSNFFIPGIYLSNVGFFQSAEIKTNGTLGYKYGATSPWWEFGGMYVRIHGFVGYFIACGEQFLIGYSVSVNAIIW
jgi:hypothetical protein